MVVDQTHAHGSMLYFITLALLKIKTHSYQTQIVVHLIWLRLLALSEIQACLCFSAETNISGGRELPQGVITTNCITCSRLQTCTLLCFSYDIKSNPQNERGGSRCCKHALVSLPLSALCCILLGRARIQGVRQAAPPGQQRVILLEPIVILAFLCPLIFVSGLIKDWLAWDWKILWKAEFSKRYYLRLPCCCQCANYSAINQIVLMRPQGRQTNVHTCTDVHSYFFLGPHTACCIFADLLKNSKTFHTNSQLAFAFQIQIMQLN